MNFMDYVIELVIFYVRIPLSVSNRFFLPFAGIFNNELLEGKRKGMSTMFVDTTITNILI